MSYSKEIGLRVRCKNCGTLNIVHPESLMSLTKCGAIISLTGAPQQNTNISSSFHD